MSQTSLALAFAEPAQLPVLAAARLLAAQLAADQAITRTDLNAVLEEHFGGSDAEGRWSVRDAHAALELAQVLLLQRHAELSVDMPAELADQTLARLESALPTQANRSDKQIEWQQFATPPRIAWLAARACALREGELVLEPSAGTGMLAVWAAKSDAKLALNEISPMRRECLAALFPTASISGHDGELLDELLAPAIAPSVVLMNPPYSHGIERGHDGRTGARHLRSAWKRLRSGGRLVAVMPEWFDLSRFRAATSGPISIRLNATIERGFIRQGTSITTRLLVLDKAESGDLPIIGKPVNFAELALLVDTMCSRRAALEGPALAAKLVPPLRLVTAARKPVPIPAGKTVAQPAIQPLAYMPLEVPAPIAEQVGHYLPYRPSRIAIVDACDHPTSLVEVRRDGFDHRTGA